MKHIAIAFLAASGVLTTHQAVAGVGGDLETFFNDMNYVNVTRPGVYEGQQAGYFTGGGIYARTPVRDFQLVGVQMPRFRAGCGGIDVYTGGFSFINADQFVQFLRTVGQNAKGLAFMLAMKVVSPQIEQTIAWLQEKAQMINQFTMDSCQAAGAAVGGALELLGQEEQACITRRVSKLGEDYGSAKVKCRNNPNDKPSLNADEDDINFHEGNIAWQAMMKNSFFRSDLEVAQLVMNITGTVVTTRDGGSDPQTTTRVIPSQLIGQGGSDPLIAALLNGGTVQIYRCEDAEVDTGKCVLFGGNKSDLTIASTQALDGKVKRLLTSLAEKIVTEAAPPTEEERGLIQATSLPVYKFLTVSTAYFAGNVDSEIATFSELIAKDIVHAYLLDLLKKIGDGASGLEETKGKAVTQFQADIRDARQQLAESQQKVSEDYDRALNFVVKARDYERALVGRLSPTVLQSAMWTSAR